jgi:hypothetical protein
MKIVSWDGQDINDKDNYDSVVMAPGYGLSQVSPQLAQRESAHPIISNIRRPGKQLFINTIINGTPVATWASRLAGWFDPDDETPKKLIVEDDTGGTNDRFVMGICERLTLIDKGGIEWIATIRLTDDIMWREITPSASSAWNITGTGQTKVVTNSGEMDAYPVLKIKPTSNKTGDYPYKRHMVARYTGGYDVTAYPLDITNNGLDTQIASTNFALANGNDLRVWVNGIEVDRWLDGPNTSTTKVWVNLDFEKNIGMLLDGNIGAGDTAITVVQDITNMPSAGTLRIDTENITYTSKSNSARTFYGCSRGVKGSSAASHTDGTWVYWLQHDIWILYGYAGAGAPPADADTKPMFRLDTSTNSSWDYDDFWDTFGGGFPSVHPRSGGWSYYLNNDGAIYTATEGGTADPASVVGCHSPDRGDWAEMSIWNPCGFSNANFQNGKKWSDDIANWEYYGQVKIKSDQASVEYAIPPPTVNSTWQAWSRNEAMTTGTNKVTLMTAPFTHYMEQYIEASDVTLTVAYPPVIVIGAEQNSYSLTCIISNNTTGQSVALEFIMETNAELELDTDIKTLIYLDDDSNQFQALTLVGGSRRDWLRLQVGANTLQFDDVGTVAVTISITHQERLYQ